MAHFTIQRRLRHIRSVLGRNILWCDQGTTKEEAGNGHESSNGTSTNSSTVTSRASSPSPSTSPTKRPLVSRALRADDEYETHFHMVHSESSSSMGSTTVEDSSLTKSAYRSKKSAREEERGLLDAYFTLHLGIDEPAFYKSETIPNTVNPSFRALDAWQWAWYVGVQTVVVARLWTRHSFPESAAVVASSSSSNHLCSQHSHRSYQPVEDFRLLIEWQIDLNYLAFIGKSVCSARIGLHGQ